MIEHLGNYSKQKANNSAIEINGLTYYFSYTTLIGVSNSQRIILRQNSWGPTTGKHLNAISTESPRLELEDFNKAVAMMERYQTTTKYLQ